mmetsp:Transcript_62386/g.153393  ORF Transcript_62386/g.153393 Transcript_62386/m.153393 type:complete len:202 (-) Transcript_62386:51-656(-)
MCAGTWEKSFPQYLHFSEFLARLLAEGVRGCFSLTPTGSVPAGSRGASCLPVSIAPESSSFSCASKFVESTPSCLWAASRGSPASPAGTAAMSSAAVLSACCAAGTRGSGALGLALGESCCLGKQNFALSSPASTARPSAFAGVARRRPGSCCEKDTPIGEEPFVVFTCGASRPAMLCSWGSPGASAAPGMASAEAISLPG